MTSIFTFNFQVETKNLFFKLFLLCDGFLHKAPKGLTTFRVWGVMGLVCCGGKLASSIHATWDVISGFARIALRPNSSDAAASAALSF